MLLSPGCKTQKNEWVAVIYMVEGGGGGCDEGCNYGGGGRVHQMPAPTLADGGAKGRNPCQIVSCSSQKQKQCIGSPR
jgi:hypothetical protein